MSNRFPRARPDEHGVDPGAVHRMVDALVSECPQLHSVMVLRHGAVVAEGFADPCTPDRPHLLFSLSKSVTSTAIGLAVGEGLLGLDDLLVDHFPELVPADPGPYLPQMRVRHLLTMTTGHSASAGGPDSVSDDWLGEFFAAPVTHEPGTHFVYNTGGSFVLSALLTRLTGQRSLGYLRPRLLEPLGIEGASWAQSPAGVDAGGSGMWMRTEDVAALGQLYLDGGTWQGRRILPEGWAELATSRHVPNDNQPDTDPAGDWAQGYGFQFWRSRWGYRGDGALGQFCVVLPDEQVVVVLTSGTQAMHRQLAIVFEHLLPGLHDVPLAPDDAAHDALVGRLDALRIAPPAFVPPAASVLSALDGRRVRFDENVFGLRDAHLELGDDLDRLTLSFAAWSGTVDLGHDAWATTVIEDAPRLFAPGAQEPDGTPLVLCAAGTWSGASYEIGVQLPSGPFRASFRLRFDGDDVEVDGLFVPDFRAPAIPTMRGRLTADLSAIPEPGW